MDYPDEPGRTLQTLSGGGPERGWQADDGRQRGSSAPGGYPDGAVRLDGRNSDRMLKTCIDITASLKSRVSGD